MDAPQITDPMEIALHYKRVVLDENQAAIHAHLTGVQGLRPDQAETMINNAWEYWTTKIVAKYEVSPAVAERVVGMGLACLRFNAVGSDGPQPCFAGGLGSGQRRGRVLLPNGRRALREGTGRFRRSGAGASAGVGSRRGRLRLHRPQ